LYVLGLGLFVLAALLVALWIWWLVWFNSDICDCCEDIGCLGDTSISGVGPGHGLFWNNDTGKWENEECNPCVNGTDGIHCWDLNENGACDLLTEDVNDDGVCNVTDCIFPLEEEIALLNATIIEIQTADIIRIGKTTQLDVPAWAWTPLTVLEDWNATTFTSGTPGITVNLTAGEFTCTKSGLYLFDLFMAYVPALPSPTHRVLILLAVNGLNVFENTIIATGEGFFGNNMDWATSVILETGDVAQYRITHDEAGKTDIINNGGGGATNLMITRLGCI
jgi:hypothetical protein